MPVPNRDSDPADDASSPRDPSVVNAPLPENAVGASGESAHIINADEKVSGAAESTVAASEILVADNLASDSNLPSDNELAGPGQFVADQREEHADSIRLVDSEASNQTLADSDAKLRRCEEILRYQFRDQSLLQSALTHASGAANRLASNERLEFLGDAILGMTVCEWLFNEYPEYTEGDLTKIKSAVVSRRSCGRTACKLGLDECLIVGRGVTRNRSYPRSLVSDVFESIIAALYLDGGAHVVRERLKEWLREEVRIAVDTQGSGNHKSVLQQYAQRELAATPIYKLVRESGPDHRKAFLIGAVVGTQVFPPAWGNNKKDAEQRAAANALASIHGQPTPHSSDEQIPPVA